MAGTMLINNWFYLIYTIMPLYCVRETALHCKQQKCRQKNLDGKESHQMATPTNDPNFNLF